MPGPSYSRTAWWYIGTISVLGLVTIGGLFVLPWTPAWQPGEVAVGATALLITLLSVAAGVYPVKLGPSQKMNLGAAATFAAVLLLAPPLAAAAAVSAGIYSAILRRPLFNVTFSAGQQALTAGAAGAVYALISRNTAAPLATSQTAVATLLAAAVYVTVADTVLGGVIATTQHRPWHTCVSDLLGQTGTQYAALIGAGSILAVCAWYAPWAIPLPALVLPLIQPLNRGMAAVAAVKEQVDEALARQRRFISDVAHEIGTPLTTLAGNVEFLTACDRGMDDPSEVRETLADIGAEFGRLAATFSQLMLLAEVDEREQVARRHVHLDRIVEEIATTWRQLAGNRGLDLDVGQLDSVEVSGDDNRIRQMIGELLENATRYTPAGGHVTLELRRTGDRARVVVADTGIGIAPEHLPHVFERFYRAPTSGELAARTRSTGGSGLGLAIAHWVAESHGGRIMVESTPGRGTSFTVEFPLESASLV